MVQKDIGYLIKNINDKLKVKADADLKRYHLTLSQSRVFTFLLGRGGQATQKEIEDHLEVAHPTVVGIVSRMEQNGHVVCWLDEKDKRNKIVRLTKQARSLARDMQENIRSNEKRMLSSFSDEDVERLKEMLTVIYTNLN